MKYFINYLAYCYKLFYNLNVARKYIDNQGINTAGTKYRVLRYKGEKVVAHPDGEKYGYLKEETGEWKYMVEVLCHNYVQGKIIAGWRYIQKDLTEGQAYALFIRKLKGKVRR